MIILEFRFLSLCETCSHCIYKFISSNGVKYQAWAGLYTCHAEGASNLGKMINIIVWGMYLWSMCYASVPSGPLFCCIKLDIPLLPAQRTDPWHSIMTDTVTVSVSSRDTIPTWAYVIHHKTWRKMDRAQCMFWFPEIKYHGLNELDIPLQNEVYKLMAENHNQYTLEGRCRFH